MKGHQIPDTTLRDLESAVKGMEWLRRKAILMGVLMKSHRISQDIVENWFGHRRQAGGGNTNTTGKLDLISSCLGDVQSINLCGRPALFCASLQNKYLVNLLRKENYIIQIDIGPTKYTNFEIFQLLHMEQITYISVQPQ